MVTQIAGGHLVCTVYYSVQRTEIENAFFVLRMLSAQVACLQGTTNISISRLLFSPFSIFAMQEVFGGFLAARSFEGTGKLQMGVNIDIVFLLKFTISTLSGRLSEPPMASPVQLESVGLCIQLSEMMRTLCQQLFEIMRKNSF